MTLENAAGGPFPANGYWPPRSTDDCRPYWPSDYTVPFDYTTPFDYMSPPIDYRGTTLPQKESIEGKLDRIIILLEQLVE